MGASLLESEPERPVQDFQRHISKMLGFHRRYMVSNKVCRLWTSMIRELDVEIMVPQHGRPFKGKEMIAQFLDWFETLECGIDNVSQQYYQIP